jgi:gluconate 2-dehydrogenase gamma chain
MNRREAIHLLALSAALPIVPRNLMALREARTLLGPPATPGTLSAHQSATVRAMAEMILPRTETPGASDVGATEFIDLILTEWYDESQRNVFRNGLVDVDSRTQALFGKDFVDATPIQQADILSSLGEKMTEEARAASSQPRRVREVPAGQDRNFYFMLRRLTLTAFYTSETGATAELNFEVIPARHDACAQRTGQGASDSH